MLTNFEAYWASESKTQELDPRAIALKAWNAASETAAKKLELSTQQLLLMAGEMNAGEIRTVKAILKNRVQALRDMSGNQPNPLKGMGI